ncbi:MAG: transglutaminase domain-containing protein [Bacteroidales bacterium]|nr:transglutaminase domain-containing protein [Bacteroidales bacterium]
MKKLLLVLLSCAAFAAVACEPVPAGPDDPEDPQSVYTSVNGRFLEAISGAYSTFEKTGTLPSSIEANGASLDKSQYVVAACELLNAISDSPLSWESTNIKVHSVPAFDEYGTNTFDPDKIDLAHVRFLAGAILAAFNTGGSLPGSIAFPTNPAENGFLPQLMIAGSLQDNVMNMSTAAVVLARVLNHYVTNNAYWPDKVSSWPSAYTGSTRNCQTDSDAVKSALADAVGAGAADAEPRQNALDIIEYAGKWAKEDYSGTRKGAADAISSGSGNSCDLAHALIAMMRAAGIPARYVYARCQLASGAADHVCAEIYLDGFWYLCDPSDTKVELGSTSWKMDTFYGRYNELGI